MHRQNWPACSWAAAGSSQLPAFMCPIALALTLQMLLGRQMAAILPPPATTTPCGWVPHLHLWLPTRGDHLPALPITLRCASLRLCYAALFACLYQAKC